MPTISRTAVVDAPVSEVWPVVSDPTRLPDWFSFADRVDVVSGSGLGQVRLQQGRFEGKRQEVEQEVVEFTPEQVIAWKQLAERLDGDPAQVRATGVVFRVEVTPEGTSTRVRLAQSLTPAGVGRAIALHLFGAAAIGATMNECLVRLSRSLA